MNEIFNDMQKRGLVNIIKITEFENISYISEPQLISWQNFDSKIAEKDQLIFQRAILPCMINQWSKN